MSETITLPKLGFDMREGTFLNWVKNVGDSINKGDVLAEIESDKATIEVESSASGVLLETLVKPGDTVPVGNPIAVVGEAPANGAAPQSAAPAPQKDAQSAPASQSAPPEPPTSSADLPSAQATAGEGPTDAPPQPERQSAKDVPGGAPQATPPTAPVQSAPPAPTAETDEDLPDGLRASPVARRIAEERKVDLRQVKGSGPNGRITKADVEGYVVPAAPTPAPIPAAAASAPTPAAPTVPAARPTPIAPALGPGMEEVPLSRLRQRIATRLVESKQTIPHFYITTEIDMDAALALRKQVNESLDDAHKITINDLIVKATALALRQYIGLNSHYYGDKVIRYQNINIGIAVAMDAGGLMNVVAKDADTTSISKLAARNKEIIAAARTGKVKPEDVEGSTFTTSNLGPYDVDQFVAIINPPEAGIIAVGSAKPVPVIVNGEIKTVTRLKATISADHRVTDGAEAAQFMQYFKKLLESPMRLLV